MAQDYRHVKASALIKSDRARKPNASELAMEAAIRRAESETMRLIIASLDRALASLRDDNLSPYRRIGTADAAVEYALKYLKSVKALQDEQGA